ncbi:MarR family transcriptional regulator, partial [Burkholderia multivorans]
LRVLTAFNGADAHATAPRAPHSAGSAS